MWAFFNTLLLFADTVMRQIKCFVDMDQCLTDFSAAVQALGPDAAVGLGENATKENKQIMYKAIDKAGFNFWAQMAWTADGKALWDWLQAQRLKPIILSSPGDFYWAEAGKREWIQNNIPGAQYFFEQNKFIYAERNAILIDDMQENVNAWNHEGGIGILHTDTNSTIQKVTDVVNKIFPQSGFKALAKVIRDIAQIV